MRRSSHRRRHIARRRVVVVLVLALAVGTWVTLSHWPQGLSGTSSSPAGLHGTTSTARPTGSWTSHPSTTGDERGTGTHTVARIRLSLVEPGSASGPPQTLSTTVWYPHAKGAPGSAPDRSDGPYPLLVFSLGFNAAVSTYNTLLTDWASAGFVVAAPTYPNTDPGQTPDETDLRLHPSDLRFVIGQVLAEAAHPGSALSGVVDKHEVGLVGQSDGGDVSLAVADDSQWRDSAVKAVAVLSGAENVTQFGGSYFSAPGPPILVVQSDTDSVNLPACSVQIYDSASQPKYYLKLLGPSLPTPWANHLDPYTQLTIYQSVIAAVTTDFFRVALTGNPSSAQAMAAAATPSVSQLTSATTAPTPAGTCPGS
jgi:dienelactone hydrolase